MSIEDFGRARTASDRVMFHLDEAIDAAYAAIEMKVAAIMAEYGEDPDNLFLYATRVRQVAYSVNSRSERHLQAIMLMPVEHPLDLEVPDADRS